MSLGNIIDIGIKSLKHLTLKKKIFLLIQIFIMLLILIPFAFYHVFSNASDDIINNQFEFREISIYGSSNDLDKYQNILDSYSNEHIVYIDSLDNHNIYAYTALKSDNKYVLNRFIPSFMPSLTHGKNLKDEYDIICPELAADFNYDDSLSSELINLKDKIGSTLTLYFYDKNNQVFSKDFNLVGTYNADFYYSYNTCYILNDTFNQLYSNIYNDSEDNSEVVKRLFTLYIDDEKNVSQITTFLDEQGIMNSVSTLDNSFVDYILFLALIILIILIVVSIIILINYFKNYYQDEYYNISLYKALGFKDKDIIKIIFVENMLLILLAMVISIIIFLILKIIITIYLHQFIAFRITQINLPVFPIIIYYLIIAFLNYIFLKLDMKEITNLSIRKIGEL